MKPKRKPVKKRAPKRVAIPPEWRRCTNNTGDIVQYKLFVNRGKTGLHYNGTFAEIDLKTNEVQAYQETLIALLPCPISEEDRITLIHKETLFNDK